MRALLWCLSISLMATLTLGESAAATSCAEDEVLEAYQNDAGEILTRCAPRNPSSAAGSQEENSSSTSPPVENADDAAVGEEDVENTENVGELPAYGEFVVRQGKERWIYGARGRCEADRAPRFNEIKDFLFRDSGSQPPQHGELYDAGVGYRYSGRCGGTVPARAIGYRAPADFEGREELVFYGSDEITVIVIPSR